MNRPGNALIVACCLSLMGCTNMVRVTPTTPMNASDDVVVILHDGSELKGKLARLDGETFELTQKAGQQRLLRQEDISTVERPEFSTTRTLLLVLGIVGIAAAYGYAKAVSSLMQPL